MGKLSGKGKENIGISKGLGLDDSPSNHSPLNSEAKTSKEIPFNEWSKERINQGRKFITSRHSKYLHDNRVMLILPKMPWGEIRERFWQLEGADSPMELQQVIEEDIYHRKVLDNEMFYPHLGDFRDKKLWIPADKSVLWLPADKSVLIEDVEKMIEELRNGCTHCYYEETETEFCLKHLPLGKLLVKLNSLKGGR